MSSSTPKSIYFEIEIEKKKKSLVWPCAKANYCIARIICTNRLRKPMVSDHLFKAGTVCHAGHEHCHSVGCTLLLTVL